MTQETQVLTHLDRFGSITAWEAMQEYRIMRLASRIADLRRKGHNIVTVTRHNGSVTWAEYKKAAPRLATENGKGVGEVGYDSTSKNITLHHGGQE